MLEHITGCVHIRAYVTLMRMCVVCRCMPSGLYVFHVIILVYLIEGRR